MAREILFKAKRLDNGEWVEGALFDGENYCVIGQQIKFSPYTENECKIVGYVVDRNTLCQCTGLTDKNGKLIWENDIVSTDLARPYLVVKYRDASFMFNCNDGEKDYYDIMLPILAEPQTQYKYGEVIGNIFDNPELLEGENG